MTLSRQACHEKALKGWETRRARGTARVLGALFILCQRPGCGGIRQVKHPCDQRRVKYCSARCAALMTRNIVKMNPAKGGRIAALRRRQALLGRLNGMTPLEAFKLGYARGLQSKWRARSRAARKAAA